MRDSVPSGSYSSVCNVLRQWQSRSSLLIESTDSMILSGGMYVRTYYVYMYNILYIEWWYVCKHILCIYV